MVNRSNICGSLLEPLCTETGRHMAREIWPRDGGALEFGCAWRSHSLLERSRVVAP